MFCDSKFNGDISKWNVSNVTDMSYMFKKSQFIGDISKWNVSNVTNMDNMFCYSQFIGDISNWNVSKVADMDNMFDYSKFKGDIHKWDISNLTSKSNYSVTNLIPKGNILPIRAGREICPFTKNKITRDYILCVECHTCFGTSYIQHVNTHLNCPYCKCVWNGVKVYYKQS
jgi:surface protein